MEVNNLKVEVYYSKHSTKIPILPLKINQQFLHFSRP